MKNLFSYCLLLLLTSGVLLQSCQKEQPSSDSNELNYADLDLPEISFIDYENIINSKFDNAIQTSKDNIFVQNSKEVFLRQEEMLADEGIVKSIEYASSKFYMSDAEKDKIAFVYQNLMDQLNNKVKPEKISNFLREEGLKVQMDNKIEVVDKQLILIYVASLKTIVDRSSNVFFGESSLRECEEWWQEAICSIYSFTTGWLVRKATSFLLESFGVDLENCTFNGNSFPQFICDLINGQIALIPSKEDCCSWWNNGNGGIVDSTECNDSKPCPPGEECVNGECVPLPCSDARPCPVGEQCIDGKCYPIECYPGKPCPDGEQCIDGKCYPL